MHHIKQALVLLQRRGFRYIFYLIGGVAIPQLGYFVLYGLPRGLVRRLAFLIATLGALAVALIFAAWLGWGTALVILLALVMLAFASLHLRNILRLNQKLSFARAHLVAHTPPPSIRLEEYPLVAEVRARIQSALGSAEEGDLVIGQIDNDGRVYGPFGTLPYVHNILREDFVPRYRFPLDIVVLDGFVLVRKDFRGNHERFASEWYNLSRLDGHANTPAVFRADEAGCVLYKNLILGRTVRDILVDAGANIFTVNVEQDESLKGLSEDERIYAVWERGRVLLSSRFPEPFFAQMEEQLDRIHACGLAKLSLTFGNIIVSKEDGRPWLIDMEGAEAFPAPRGMMFEYQRDRDREKYNQIYGRSLFTEKSVRRILRERFSNTYAPIDFGRGLVTHGFWDTDSGTGRWDYFNGRVVEPLVQGKRVLDLGINNGIMDLMMLKGGASRVVGLEYSEEFVQMAGDVHRIFEWRDMRTYPFTVHHADMRAVLADSLGDFDVVTAFCSLYYLEPEDMAAVVRKASQMAPLMILQAKTNARREVEEKGKKSSTEFLARLLVENGFPKVETVNSRGFTRPILIGRKDLR